MGTVLTRADMAWVVGIALLFTFVLRAFEVSGGTTVLIVLLSSLGRLGYAVYARSTWR